MKNISVKNAVYIEDYKIQILFEDGTSRVIDFEKAIMKQQIQNYKIYQDIENFKQFRIDNGNVVWGKDWDIIFPLNKLYNGKI